MSTHEEHAKNLRMMGKEKMTGQFSWATETEPYNTKKTLTSGILKVPNLPDFEFSIRGIKTSDGNNTFRIRVEVLKTPSTELYSQVSISGISDMDVDMIEHPWQEWGARPLKKSDVLIADKSFVSIICEISWFGYKRTTASLIYSPSHLHDVYMPFLMQSSFSDVTIIIGEEQIPAHKLILVAHSSVLKSMFENDMKEARENRVVINDITSDVMRNVLSILYTGCNESLEDSEMALKILFVADKYDMKNLKHCCEYKLSQQLTAANVVEFLESADLHNAENLKADCLQFMCDNNRAMADNADVRNLGVRKPILVCDLLNLFFHRECFCFDN